MGAGKAIGFGFLALLWVWLCVMLIRTAGGFTLKNLILICFSGIIIFVPLWKKYFRSNRT